MAMTTYYTVRPPESAKVLHRCEPRGIPQVWQPETGTWEEMGTAFARTWFESPWELYEPTEEEARAIAPAAFA